MTELERWHEANDAYLGLALAWLRLMLTRAGEHKAVPAIEPPAAPAAPAAPVPPPALSAPSEPSTGETRRRWWRRYRPDAPTPAPVPPAPRAISLPAPSAPVVGRAANVTDADIAAAAAAMAEAAAAMTRPPALQRIGEDLRLSPFERHVLLLCVAPELDTSVPALYSRAHGNPWPTFALALSLFDQPAWDVLSPERPLRYWHLLEISQTSGQSLVTCALRADERVVNALKGLDHLDDRLAPILERVDPPTAPPPPSQEPVVSSAAEHVLDPARALRAPLLELVGRDRSARTAMAAQIAARVGLPLYRLPTELLPSAPAELDLMARLLHREAVLSPLAVYLDAEDVDDRSPGHAAVTAFLSRVRMLLFVGGRDVRADLPLPSVLVDVIRPTAPEQQVAWEAALGGNGDIDVSRLVAQFDLDTDTIERLAVDARAGGGEQPMLERLWDECRRHARPRLEALAQRLQPKAEWDQLVLPETETALLRQIADQVARRGRVYEEWGFAERMNRGLGISALFAGESGTGKTMAAEVLANALALDLYRIDLSSVVSKYIGETEKNLRKLFDAAERGGVILFFDEADALFGKRSEVKDAHDRYANIEISYLLQRMEAYSGLAILATNMKSAMDRAFVRRLRFIVNFPFPTVADRARIWARTFPSGAPVAELDIDRLARLNLTGAGIHNAALNAAFMAAEAGGSITMREVLDAARNELRKLDRPINEADFRLPEVVRA